MNQIILILPELSYRTIAIGDIRINGISVISLISLSKTARREISLWHISVLPSSVTLLIVIDISKHAATPMILINNSPSEC
jgi:hypothetical protein